MRKVAILLICTGVIVKVIKCKYYRILLKDTDILLPYVNGFLNAVKHSIT